MSARTLAMIAGGVAVLSLVLALVPGVPDAVYAVVGVIVVVGGPGLGLLLALRAVPGLQPASALALTLAGSLAAAVVVGVVLAALPVGLTATSAPVTLACVTIVLAAAAVIRPASGAVGGVAAFRSFGSNAVGIALVSLALVVAAGAVTFARLGAQRTSADGQVTELSLASAPGGRAVDVFVANHQQDARNFRVVVSSTAAQTPTHRVAVRNLNIADGAERSVRVALPSGVTVSSVRAALYAAGRSQALRVVGAAAR